MKNNIAQKNIPQGWNQTTLEKIMVENAKSKLKVSDADNIGSYPFFTSGEKVFSHSDFFVKGENIYMATGGVANIKFFNGKASYSTDTYSFKSKENTEFLYYILLNNIKNINKQHFSGSGLKHLQKNDLKKNFILLPSITEQQKIAEILGAVDEDIAKTQDVIEATEKLKKGLMQELFTRGIDHTKFKKTKLGEIPEEWEVGGFENFVNPEDKNAIKLGPFGSTLKKEFYVEKGFKIYGQEQVIKGDSTFGNYYISEKKYKELEAFKISAGDILISLVGTIGKILIVPENFERGVINPCLLKITPDKRRADSKFIAHLLKSDFLIQQMSQKSHGGTMNILNKGMLMSVMVGLPSLDEQQKIAEILSAVDEKIFINKKLKNKLIFLKKGLMQDLLSGKVRV